MSEQFNLIFLNASCEEGGPV